MTSHPSEMGRLFLPPCCHNKCSSARDDKCNDSTTPQTHHDVMVPRNVVVFVVQLADDDKEFHFFQSICTSKKTPFLLLTVCVCLNLGITRLTYGVE